MQPRFCRRVPVLKCIIKAKGNNLSQRVNICVGMTDGPKAVKMLQEYLAAMPPLCPIVLVIKAILKVRHICKMVSDLHVAISSLSLQIFLDLFSNVHKARSLDAG